MSNLRSIRSLAAVATALAVASLLAACVEEPPPRPPTPPPPPPRVAPPPPPVTEVYAYPLHGQPPAQQDRDHYECSIWATQQTGFDPSAPGVPPHERVRVVSAGPPPGTGAAVGAMTGAVIGAAVSNPWQAGAGALAGAVVGGTIGAVAQASTPPRTETVVVPDRQAMAVQEQKASNYRRAISACLDARGYSVR